MEKLTYIVTPWEHGMYWWCHSTNFVQKGTTAMFPMVEGNCTVHIGFMAESHARLEALIANK